MPTLLYRLKIVEKFSFTHKWGQPDKMYMFRNNNKDNVTLKWNPFKLCAVWISYPKWPIVWKEILGSNYSFLKNVLFLKRATN